MENKKESPREYDVVCGRGKVTHNHPGNKRFRQFINSLVNQYKSAQTRHERTFLIIDIVDAVRNSGGAFVKRIDGEWIEISDQQARKKVSHALRDAIAAQKQASEQEEKKLLDNYDIETPDSSTKFCDLETTTSTNMNHTRNLVPMIENQNTYSRARHQEVSRTNILACNTSNEIKTHGEKVMEYENHSPIRLEDAFHQTFDSLH